MNSPYVFDAVFIIILLFMFNMGKRRGAFRILAGLFGTIVAWIGAALLGPTFTPVTESLLAPYTHRAVSSALESMGSGAAASVEKAVSVGSGLSGAAEPLMSLGRKISALGLPSQLETLATKLGISETLDKLLNGVSGTVKPGELLSQALAEKLAPVLTFFVLFIIIKTAIFVVTRFLSHDWPILGTLNRLQGGIIGLAGGVMLVFAICAGILKFGSAEPTGLTSAVMLRESMIGGLAAALLGK